LNPHPSQLESAAPISRCDTFPLPGASRRRGKEAFGCCWSLGGMPRSRYLELQPIQESRAAHFVRRPSAGAMTRLPLLREAHQRGRWPRWAQERSDCVIIAAGGGSKIIQTRIFLGLLNNNHVNPCMLVEIISASAKALLGSILVRKT